MRNFDVTLKLQGIECFAVGYIFQQLRNATLWCLTFIAMLSQLAPLTAADRGTNSPTHQIKDVVGWKVHVSNVLLEHEAPATEKALALLAQQLQEIDRVVPAAAVTELRKVPLWFSPEYPQAAARAEYHPGANWLRKQGRDPALVKAVEFTNISIFEREAQRMPNFALHELAHAYHDLVIEDGFENTAIKAAYDKAKANGRYEKVEQRFGDGRSVQTKAYALQNPQEYFAECSEAFFSTNDFYPFHRDQLVKHDPEMFALLQRLWGVPPDQAPSFDLLQRKQLGEALPKIRWLDDGDYTTLRSVNSSGDKSELLRCSVKGTEEVLVSIDQLIPAGSAEPLTIDGYELSKDMDWVLIYTNSVKVWRKKTRGDYWLLRRSTGKLTKLCPSAPPSELMHAKLSPDAKHVGYVWQNNLYVESMTEGTIRPLTTDGSQEILNGIFDWVYEEEFHARDGWRWSPDGQKIAYWQLNTEAVKKFTMADYTSDKYPKLKTFAYPKTGECNSTCRIGVCSLENKQTVWLNISGNSAQDYYLPRMAWVEHSGQLIIQKINRRQNALDVLLADPQTGSTQVVLTERDNAWIDIHDDSLHWNKKGDAFTWISERDGWRQLYYVSTDGTTTRRVTNGQHDVIKVLHVDDKTNRVFYIASPSTGTEQFLYCGSITGKSAPKRLTPESSRGWHEYLISPNGKFAIHTCSNFDSPPQVNLISLPQHKVLRPLVKNASLINEVKQLTPHAAEFFQIPIEDGVKLDAWLMKPADYNPTKKYPVLFYVYGEPAAQSVTNQWHGKNHLWHLQLTHLGYFVVCVDNRGTPGPRGRAWRKAAFRKIGSLAAADQAAATKELLKRPDFDPERVAVWGWSGGGSATLNLLFRYPEIYKAGMAIASVPDMRMYNTIYQERYMGLPQENEQDYIQGSPITHAHGLKGNLLLIHGTGDDNCHHQGIELLVNKLVDLNLHFSMMSYPNRSHSIDEGENTTRHLFDLLKQYLVQHVTPGAK